MQKYKLYINEKPLILTTSGNESEFLESSKEILMAKYTGKVKSLFQYIDTLEKPSRFDGIIIHSEDFESLKNDLQSIFESIKASGGLVINPLGEVLFIFRRGFWDLPKGKVDYGEGRKIAGIREVKEETGIKSLELGPKLCKTRHMYRNSKGKRILKITQWYIMRAEKQPLKPQLAEDITLAEWKNPDYFLENPPKIYRSILDVLNIYLESRTEEMLNVHNK